MKPPVSKKSRKGDTRTLIALITGSILAFILAIGGLSLSQREQEETKKGFYNVGFELQTSAGANKAINETVTIEELPDNTVQDPENTETEAEENTEEILEEQYILPEDIKISYNMNMYKTSGISKEDFCMLMEEFEEWAYKNLGSKFKNNYNGYFTRNAEIIWDLCQKYTVNEFFFCGLTGLESYYFSNKWHMENNNPASTMKGGKLIHYDTEAEGIEKTIRLISNRYLNPEGKYHKGFTLESMQPTYCPPDKAWDEKTYACMKNFIPKYRKK